MRHLPVTLMVYSLYLACAQGQYMYNESRILSRSEVVDSLLKDYETGIPPDFESDTATLVKVQLYVNNIDSIKETTMDFSIEIYLRLSWMDRRLRYNISTTQGYLELDSKVQDLVWVPDMFFTNEKTASFHMVTVPNRLMHIYPNGKVFYSVRISMTLSCHMRLEKYPLDMQTCSIQMESYGYSLDNIRFQWMGDAEAVTMNSKMQLPHFSLTGKSHKECVAFYDTRDFRTYGPLETIYTYNEAYLLILCVAGNFSCLRVNFNLKRSIGFYIVHIYVPSILIVILSWVSFWLNVDAIPARISLGVLTVLTLTTQGSLAISSLPRVSYIKAIDVWMAVCLFFVFAALLEFAGTNVMYRRDMRRHHRALNDISDVTFCHDTEKKLKSQSAESADICAFFKKKTDARALDKVSRYLFPFVFLLFNIVYWTFYTL